MWTFRLCRSSTFSSRVTSAPIRSVARRFLALDVTTPLVSHEIINGAESGIAIVTMQRPPVNALSLEMCQALTETIQTIESLHPDTQGLVLQSSSPKVFSAGLDLKQLYQPDVTQLERLWNAFQQLYMTLYGSRLATVAAIQGHAPAGACMVALCCDYRIMASNNTAKIGLNESKLGIGLPPWLIQQMIDTVGQRQAEISMSLGTLFTAEEALRIQLVDELVERESLLERAMDVSKLWASIPSTARVATKEKIRRPRIDRLHVNRTADTSAFIESVLLDTTQQMLGDYLKTLGKR